MKQYFIYFMASETGTLYIGLTDDLKRRVYEHKNKLIEGFTKEYDCTKLVYYELYNDINQTIEREKQIKKWRRNKKENLIRQKNPGWRDLYDDL